MAKAKTARQLEREIQDALGLPESVMKRWRAKVSAYRTAVSKLEAGFSTAALLRMAKARDALDKVIGDAIAHIPYVANQPAYLAPPILALQEQRKRLVAETWERAQERGRAANLDAINKDRRRINDEIREANRPYEWMRDRR